MGKVSEAIPNRIHQTECWHCGRWYNNSAKSCSFCHTPNDDNDSNFGFNSTPAARPKPNPAKVCPQCKKEFNSQNKFCSKNCSNLSQRTGFDQKAYLKAYYQKRKLQKQQRTNPDKPQTRTIAE